MNRNIEKQIRKQLRQWYRQHKRDLPWRHTKDPYKIWVSEIILQQTRVAQGYDYFLEFINTFQDIEALASAKEDDVLKVWQGLGYYSRAINMHKTAQIIVAQYGSTFPQTYAEIISLPGIGNYTAAAILSFSFDQKYAVLDGNVMRILTRIYELDIAIDTNEAKKQLTIIAQNLLDIDNPALHNQAIMEFGALQCTPKNPVCESCVLNSFCLSYKNNTVNLLPTKRGKIKIKQRHFNFLLINDKNGFYIEKREQNDIWKNLYQLPLIESDKSLEWIDLLQNEQFLKIVENIEFELKTEIITFKHLLTHQTIFAKFFTLNLINGQIEQLIKIKPEELLDYAVPKVIELFFNKINEE